MEIKNKCGGALESWSNVLTSGSISPVMSLKIIWIVAEKPMMSIVVQWNHNGGKDLPQTFHMSTLTSWFV